MNRRMLTLVAALAVAGALSGCRVNVDKDKNGDEKRVQIDTPFGGMHVNTDQTKASDLGLPEYPGAQTYKDSDNNQSADVHMGFGPWQLRVRAVSYSTPDSPDKVLAFYKKALGRYGDVISCKDKQPVGTPTATAEGLTCEDDSSKHINVNTEDDKGKKGISITTDDDAHKGKHLSVHNDLELKAGSKKHQHIVGIEEDKSEPGKTIFSMVSLDLPGDSSGDKDD